MRIRQEVQALPRTFRGVRSLGLAVASWRSARRAERPGSFPAMRMDIRARITGAPPSRSGAGSGDAAVGWFHRGQLRARIHLVARPNPRPDEDPALFASLNEVVGRPVNEDAFGNLPKLVATLDRLLAGHDDTFTPKTRSTRPHASVSAGPQEMQDRVVREFASIPATRERNGLSNEP